MIISQIIIVAVISSFLGFFMKISDLLDEHGFKWFRCSDILTGIIWGSLCSVLILYNELLAILWLSIVIGFLVRGLIDYRNHQIAIAIVALTVLFSNINILNHIWRFIFLFSFLTITGLIHDYIQYKNKNINRYLKKFFYDYHLHWYTVITFYLLWTKDIIVFISLVFFSYFYGLVACGKINNFLKKIGIHK